MIGTDCPDNPLVLHYFQFLVFFIIIIIFFNLERLFQSDNKQILKMCKPRRPKDKSFFISVKIGHNFQLLYWSLHVLKVHLHKVSVTVYFAAGCLKSCLYGYLPCN